VAAGERPRQADSAGAPHGSVTPDLRERAPGAAEAPAAGWIGRGSTSPDTVTAPEVRT